MTEGFATSACVLELADEFPDSIGRQLDAHLIENEGDLLALSFLADLGRWWVTLVVGNDAEDHELTHRVASSLESKFVDDALAQDGIATGFLEALPTPDEAEFEAVNRFLGPALQDEVTRMWPTLGQ